MKIKKKFLKNIFIQQFFGFILFIYITFVRLTSSINLTNQSIPNKFWKDNMTEEEYFITRCSGTEPPFTGKYYCAF